MKSMALAVFTLAALLTGCAGVESRVKQGRVMETINQKPEARAYWEAIGIGASDPALPTETQRKALARDAAIVKAQYEMLSMITGVHIEGGVAVDRALEVDSRLQAHLMQTIKGAVILKSEFTKDNGCVVTIRLPKEKFGFEL
jgi:hypothetical protein